MKMKKVLTGVLAAAMTISVAGCGNGKNNVGFVEEDMDTVLKNPYEINWYMSGTPQDDVAEVEKEINAYIKDKINATVKINIMESSQYQEQMASMMQAGEYFDMCFTAEWQKYDDYAENGAFLALDGHMEKYMPKTYELSDKKALECAKVNGKIYALPVIKENTTCYGWIYRKDIAEKYNIDMTKIKSFEELEPYLMMIKEKEPSISYPIDWADSDATPSGGYLDYNILGGAVMALTDANSTKVKNVLETEKYMEGCRLAHRFYNEGLVREDILVSSSEMLSNMKNGKTFCTLYQLKPGKAQELFKDSEYEFEQAPITEPKKPVLYGLGAMTAVSATSKNPARVLRFIELLNTDEYLNNLVIYGIEGKHYEKQPDGRVKLLDNSKYSLSGNQWMVANVYLTYPTSIEEPDKNKLLKEYDESGKVSNVTGFKFRTEPIQMELAACANVDKQYRNQLTFGAVDPDSIYEKYMSELKKAGIDEIKAEVQKQLDEFIAARK